MTMSDDVPTYIWAKMEYSTTDDASDDSETDDLTSYTDDDYDSFIDCNNANYNTFILNNRLQLLSMMYSNHNSSSYDQQCIKEDITNIKQMIRQNWEVLSGHAQVTHDELEQMKLMVHDMLKYPELLYLSPLYSSSNRSSKEDATKKMTINTTTSTTASSQVTPMSFNVNEISPSLQSMQIITPSSTISTLMLTTPPNPTTTTGQYITSGIVTPAYLCRECSPPTLTRMDKPRMMLLKTVPLPY